MAQRTGADSFLAPKAKAASARCALVLAVAAVVALAGCGGGSGDPSGTASVSQSQGAAQGASAAAQAQGDKSSSSSSSSSQGKAKQGEPASAGAAPPSGGEAKHGKHIVLPKGEPEPAPTAAEQAQATVADIALASPDLQGATGEAAEAALPATYTCDGKGSWPSLQWSGVPGDTAELILYVMNAQPLEGKLVVDWAVAGIDPSLAAIQAGRLPKGAVVGLNSFGKRGYEICPPQGETYVFALYALPQRLNAQPGFDPRALRERILDLSGNVGLMATSYVRG